MAENKTTMTQYQPGDVANGHMLGHDNQWHPVNTSRPTLRGWKLAAVIGVPAVVVIGVVALPNSDSDGKITVNEAAQIVVDRCRSLEPSSRNVEITDQERENCVARGAERTNLVLDRSGLDLVRDDGTFVSVWDADEVVLERAQELWNER